MFLDHERKSVRDITNTLEGEALVKRLKNGQCPGCGGKVTAVRPSLAQWHWRHSASRPSTCDAGGETPWHLAVKAALHETGYLVEYRMGDWRFDAFSDQHEFIVVEAVNSLSDRYFDKADAISPLGTRALWIINEELLRKPATSDLTNALRKTGATIWWLSKTSCSTEDHGPVTSDLAARILAETSGRTFEEAKSQLDANHAQHMAVIRKIEEREAAAKLRYEEEARQAAKVKAEATRKLEWAQTQLFEQTVNWVKEKFGFSPEVSRFYAWRMLKEKEQTRIGMPTDAPPLSEEGTAELDAYDDHVADRIATRQARQTLKELRYPSLKKARLAKEKRRRLGLR